jgi:hypothetical protein
MRKYYISITLFVTIGAFVLSACGSVAGKKTPTPTQLSVADISTAAAQTVIAQLTQQAPTMTLTPILTDTPVATEIPLFPTATEIFLQPTSANCANAIYISDVTIPDGTQLPVNQTFTKTWRVQNTGSCTWTTSFRLAFSYGELMGGQAVLLPNPVAVGQQVNISVNLTVPNKAGKLTGAWVLVDDKGQHFGQILTVVINVGAVSLTPTGSLTATPTRTVTPGSGSTSTPTNTKTPVPTQTLTPTEMPSETPTSTPS